MARYRVLTGEWCHETNTFCTIPTTIQNFHDQYYLASADTIFRLRRGTKSVLGATFEAADEYDWDLMNSISASANPTGKLTSETYEVMCDQILSKCSGDVHFDGVVLHLHGAMVSECYEDCEGELLKRLREQVGQDVPIVVTLDLHANVTSLMAQCASVLLAVRTYPHIDFYETAQRACRLLQRSMTGEILPATFITKGPLLMGLDGGKTTRPDHPMVRIVEKGRKLEASGKCVVTSICAGFTAADIYEIGPSVTVTVDLKNPRHQNKVGDVCSAQEYANSLGADLFQIVWETKEFQSEKHRSVEEVVKYAKTYCNTESLETKPLVMADVSDNPGSGHYGDATNLLRGLVDSDLTDIVFYAIYDPNAVLDGQRIGVGNVGEILLGGKTDPMAGGPPLRLSGKVVALMDGCFQTFGPMGFGGVWQNYGLSMLFRVRNTIDVIVISNNGQLLDLAQITSLGCDPLHKQIIAVKSKQHFRACLEPVAGEIATVDGGGLGSVILSKGDYKHVRRPIWPLDNIESFP